MQHDKTTGRQFEEQETIKTSWFQVAGCRDGRNATKEQWHQLFAMLLIFHARMGMLTSHQKSFACAHGRLVEGVHLRTCCS